MTDDNHRVALRHRVLKSAKIISPNNWSVMDCKLRDVSDTGAQLIVGDQVSIPNEFMLLFPAEKMVRDAKVMWRKDQSVGVEFTSEKRAAPTR
jgi:PilZ domain